MEKIADAGKLCIYRFGASADGSLPLEAIDQGQSQPRLTHEEYVELSKKQLELYLALYLIGAQPYSYFQWNWGWDLRTGPLEHYPEFHKPLGKPLGQTSSQDGLHDLAVDVGESALDAVVVVGEFLVVQPEQLQHGRVKVIHGGHVHHAAPKCDAQHHDGASHGHQHCDGYRGQTARGLDRRICGGVWL